ncbi:MAG: P1 family peptidase [Deltaproteobacteria bacterium]|nr:P1 family peptidase [Deltaproteobacteria bacterium]
MTTNQEIAEIQQDCRGGLTAVPGVAVGHFTDPRHWTGCTVILADKPAPAGVDVRGGAPGTLGTDSLRPGNMAGYLNGLLISGGSAFGLEASFGVMRFLKERNIGLVTAFGVVPKVAAAVIYDLGVSESDRPPGVEAGYAACLNASKAPVVQGCVGAGTGATVGKLAGRDKAMKGGLGSASICTDYGLIVGALAVVNAWGNIIEPSSGAILAGARDNLTGGFIDPVDLIKSQPPKPRPAFANTTIGVVVTNAELDTTAMTVVAKMAHSGLARAVNPCHTLFDGDAIFALSVGRQPVPDPNAVGILAAEAMTQAIISAVKHASSAPGLPSWAEFHKAG